MPTITPALVLCWALLQLLGPGAQAIRCQVTDTGFQAHSRDCGPYAKGCRTLVKPYNEGQNNSAVGPCSHSTKPGDFMSDCAVDCPAKLDWNEVICCSSGDNCNGNLVDVTKKNYCYIQSDDPRVFDDLVICKADELCGLEQATGTVKCVPETSCKGGEFKCCTSAENCGFKFGIYSLKNSQLSEEESTDANNVTASLTLSIVSLLLTYASVY